MVLNNFKKAGRKTYFSNKGFSLVEIIVVSAVMLLVFGGLLISFKYTLTLVSHSRAKLTALTVANSQMEYIRSLSYDAVGTVSGIPTGAIPQVSTTTLNGILFTKTVLINYVDDPKDGVGAADSNDITTDYKQAKITITWNERDVPQEIFLVTNITPKSIETSVGGGTLRVNVFDSKVAPLPGADVRLINNTVVPHIDVTKSTDSTGVALFGGAPAGPDYEISVTAPGYSTDQTYKATTTLPNPNTQPVAVVEADISTMNFFIDKLSNLSVKIVSDKNYNSFNKLFNDFSAVAASTSVNISSGKLQLAGSSGSYATSGTAYLDQVNPGTFDSWDLVTLNSTVSASTSVLARFYTGSTSPYTLIPESDLPGNSSGFSAKTINLTRLSTTTYPALVVGLQLKSTTNTVTPTISDLSVQYLVSKTPLSGASVNIKGTKTLGTMLDTSIVYKNNFNYVTDATGLNNLNNIEWDSYTTSVSGYDIKEACNSNPLALSPGSSTTLELLVTPNTSNNLRVIAVTASGQPIPGATVTLQKAGFSDTETTSSCGQVYFANLNSANTYSVTISPDGYTAQSFANIDITGDIVQVATF
jgi:type II secretory pathway pseudopilin PulG